MVVHITESHEQGISAPTTMIVTMVHYHSHSMERVNSRLSLSADCYSFDRPGFLGFGRVVWGRGDLVSKH